MSYKYTQTRLRPGVYYCPFCGEAEGTVKKRTKLRQEYNAGGKWYLWIHWVGHFKCRICRRTWTERFS